MTLQSCCCGSPRSGTSCRASSDPPPGLQLMQKLYAADGQGGEIQPLKVIIDDPHLLRGFDRKPLARVRRHSVPETPVHVPLPSPTSRAYFNGTSTRPSRKSSCWSGLPSSSKGPGTVTMMFRCRVSWAV